MTSLPEPAPRALAIALIVIIAFLVYLEAVR